MSEDLRQMITSTTGEGPSEKFATELRAKVIGQSHEAMATLPPSDPTAIDAPPILDVEFQQMREKKMNIKLVVGGLIAAAMIVIAGFVAAAVGSDGTNEKLETIDEDSVTTTTQSFELGAEPSAEARAVIDQYFASEGWAGIEASLAPAALELIRQDDYEDFLAASRIFGSTLSVDSCEQMSATVVRCQISTMSAITQAMGDEPTSQAATFNIIDGKLTTSPNLTLLAETRTFGSFAKDAGIEVELGVACQPNYFDGPCAQFMMDNLDGWVAWDKEQQ